MKFTGERFIPTEKGAIRLEHYHRYVLTLDAVRGKDVLDVACGAGYGSFLISTVARSVVGVDISTETVEYALGEYKDCSNLSFMQGSATKLAFPRGAFDAVVSFETVEHLAEQEEMLAEIRRVLRPDGILIISSPNRPVYSEGGNYHNEFHIKELDFNEFDKLLKTQFDAIEYHGQRLNIGSVIQPLASSCLSLKAWHDDGKSLILGTDCANDPVYYLAVCAATAVPLPVLEPSVVHPADIDLVKQYIGFAKLAQTLGQDASERDAKISSLSEEISLLNLDAVSREQQLFSLRTQVDLERERMKAVMHSHSWRITRPLRVSRRCVAKIVAFVRKVYLGRPKG